MNLTAVTERSAVMERHIVDSLALLPVMEATYAEYNQNKKDVIENVKIVDIGTGAGLPGIVIAIARPCKSDVHCSPYSFIGRHCDCLNIVAYAAWDVTLMESLQKRCNFLEHVVGELGLSNVRVIRSRAEVCGSLYMLSVIKPMRVYLMIAFLCHL